MTDFSKHCCCRTDTEAVCSQKGSFGERVPQTCPSCTSIDSAFIAQCLIPPSMKALPAAVDSFRDVIIALFDKFRFTSIS